jgi:acetyl-CoA C-acetyltransferase
MSINRAFVIGGLRTPFAKSMGAYQGIRIQELMTASLELLVKKFQLEGKILGDVGIGALLKSSISWNFARECVLGSSLHPETPAFNMSRACGTGLDIVGTIALKILTQEIDIGIAGGVDTNSDLPLEYSYQFTQMMMAYRNAKTFKDRMRTLFSFRPHHLKPQIPWVVEPRTGLSMGEHCELMVKEWKISREEQDKLALVSHLNAESAYAEGFYDDLLFEMKGTKKDTIIRGDTTLDKLKKLKPAFDKTKTGTLTAGNSSPLTDGSATVLLANEEKAKTWNLPLLAEFVDYEVAAVNFVGGEGLLLAPTIAVSRLLDRQGLQLQDFDVYEVHEAFAGQVLCTLKAWESDEYCKKRLGKSKALGPIDRTKMNLKGGSVALGHPFSATGCRQVATLAKILSKKKNARGLISICTGGGMGVAAILKSV